MLRDRRRSSLLLRLAPTALLLLGISQLSAPVSVAQASPLVVSATQVVPARGTTVSLGVTVVKPADGTVRIFSVTSAGGANERVLRGSTWGASVDLGGGTFRSAPAPVQRGDRIDIFAVRSDGTVLQRTSTSGRWGAWATIPVRGFAGPLSATWTTLGDLHLFGPNVSGRIRQAIFRHGVGWGGSQQLTSNVMRGNVSLVYSGAGNRFDLFSVDSSTRITQRTFSGGRWSAWHPISKIGFGGGIAAVHPASGSWRVIGRGTNNSVYELTYRAGHWRGPVLLGGNAVGFPAGVLIGASGRYFTTGHTAVVSERSIANPCCSWYVVRTSPPASVPTSRVEIARALLAQWGGKLSGTPAAHSDLSTTAAGRAIHTSCGRSVYLDPAMLRIILGAVTRYRVYVNNMVSGHGCDSGYHPQGKAVDFNRVTELSTGRTTNWHTGSGSDNRALDAQFLSFAASFVTHGGGAGQANCAGSAHAPLPAGMFRFADACTHQHLDTRP